MTKNTKIILAILLVVIVAILIYFFTKKKSEDKETSTSTKSTSGLAGWDLGGIIGGFMGGKGTQASGSELGATSSYEEFAGTDGWALMNF